MVCLHRHADSLDMWEVVSWCFPGLGAPNNPDPYPFQKSLVCICCWVGVSLLFFGHTHRLNCLWLPVGTNKLGRWGIPLIFHPLKQLLWTCICNKVGAIFWPMLRQLAKRSRRTTAKSVLEKGGWVCLSPNWRSDRKVVFHFKGELMVYWSSRGFFATLRYVVEDFIEHLLELLEGLGWCPLQLPWAYLL